MRVAFVVWMNGNGGVAKHRFGSGRRDLDRERTVLTRITDLPQEPIALFILDFSIRERRLGFGIPIHEAGSAGDQALAV